MRHNEQITEDSMQKLQIIFDMMDKKLQFPSWFNISHIKSTAQTDEEEAYMELRNEIQMLIHFYTVNPSLL